MYSVVRSVVRFFEQMRPEEYVLVLGAVVLTGFLCLRGFGSRSRY